MNTLFPIAPITPEGFSYLEDFLLEEEERHLLEILAHVAFQPFSFQGYTARRRVASYGFHFHFSNGKLEKGSDIPSDFSFLLDKISLQLNLDKNALAALLVTEYPPGSIINWHRDAPPFGLVAGISLQTDCVFKLRPMEKKLQTKQSIISLTIKKRSLYVLDGAARTDWQHSIAPVDKTRFTITVRTLKNGNMQR